MFVQRRIHRLLPAASAVPYHRRQITAVFAVYGEADTVSIPVVPQGTEGIIIDILGNQAIPWGGHFRIGVAVFVCQLTVFHMESPCCP